MWSRNHKKTLDIDDCELDGSTLQESFVMGYELALLECNLQSIRTGFQQHVHAANQDRVINSLKGFGRKYRLSWMENDKTETWMWLEVAPKKRP